MTADGTGITKLMEELKKVYTATARLLATADTYMKEVGWALRTNQCVSVTTVPSEAAYWFPCYAFRVYKHKACPQILAFVSVIFDDREGGNSVPQPLLSAGWLDYGHGTEVTAEMATEEMAYDYVDWHRYVEGHTDDGRLLSVDWRKRPEFGKFKVQQSATLAVPLVGVRNPDDLKKQVITPLLDSLKQQIA